MQIQRAKPLKAHNTLALKASASAYVSAHSRDDIVAALDWARVEGLPVLPMGEGSNVVLAGDLKALVLCQSEQRIQLVAERGDTVSVQVSAGYNWHALVGECLDRGWYGLENLALIPGQAGAAPIQNIGAYGVEVERFVEAVHGIYIENGEAFSFSTAECHFGYRDSVFKRELRDSVVITAIDLRLSTRPDTHVVYPALQEELDARGIETASPADVYASVVAVRSRRLPDPMTEPNAGSFFKNPVIGGEHADELHKAFPQLPLYELDDGTVKLAAAWLIEQCGWKGRREGDIAMHDDHALVLVNRGTASGAELLAYAGRVVASVQHRFGVALEMEPRIYGN
ncbi:UDP-N-acetylmuramate dehydrogenase [Halioglobus maricola]|uniref:UDP-N-acetylmuramate dehydrogenase n=1 Tax=Halioglobus maricola TaxID=2601894 RepID=UPI00197AA3B5|nr:UDP-N-acetylmuramate dehydrogenase [Halioglobus maricola]